MKIYGFREAVNKEKAAELGDPADGFIPIAADGVGRCIMDICGTGRTGDR